MAGWLTDWLARTYSFIMCDGGTEGGAELIIPLLCCMDQDHQEKYILWTVIFQLQMQMYHPDIHLR